MAACHHAPGHHRAAPLGGQDRAHGAARPLTGLPNRVLLNERLEHALAASGAARSWPSHMLDLDHFKNVNDTLGHPAGDKLLKMVTERLRALVRETDTVARMGGDEFAVVQVAIAQPADATSLAQRVIEAVSKPYDIEVIRSSSAPASASPWAPSDGMSPDRADRNADLALYRAKGDGRGTFRFFEPEMDAQMQARRAWSTICAGRLTAASSSSTTSRSSISQSNEITGFEALIRWQHPEKAWCARGSFPLAEEIGFIVALGEWVISKPAPRPRMARSTDGRRQSLARAIAQPGLRQVIMARSTPGLAPGPARAGDHRDGPPGDSEATLASVAAARAGHPHRHGRLRHGLFLAELPAGLPFDKIKIDRSFVTGIADDAGSLNIVRAVARRWPKASA